MSTVLLGILAVPNKQAFWSLFVVIIIIIIIRSGKKIRAPDGIESHVVFLICLNVSAWCSYESHVLVLIWQCDCVMQLWVTRSCPDLTMWLGDAVMSHTFLSWSDNVTGWCSYESHVLVLIWLSDCVMQLWVTRACPDLTIWLRDAVKSHTCLSWSDYLTGWCRSSQRPIFTVIFHPCSPSNLQ